LHATAALRALRACSHHSDAPDLQVVVAHLLIARCNSVDDLFCNLPAPNRVRTWAKAGLLHRAKVGFAPGQRPMADDIVCGFA
jgi:hypothetical protein